MLNNCSFIGRLGADPESRYTTSGKQVVTISLAVSEKYGDKETTEWVRVIVWDKLASICEQYLSKGSLVYFSGRMQTRQWEDQQGQKRYSTEIIAREMKMLGSKSDQSDQSQRDHGVPEPPITEDDLPF